MVQLLQFALLILYLLAHQDFQYHPEDLVDHSVLDHLVIQEDQWPPVCLVDQKFQVDPEREKNQIHQELVDMANAEGCKIYQRLTYHSTRQTKCSNVALFSLASLGSLLAIISWCAIHTR